MKKITVFIIGIILATSLSYGQDKGKNSFVLNVDWQINKATVAGITTTSKNYLSITTGYRNFLTEHFRLGVNFGMHFNNNASDGDLMNIFAPGIDLAWYIKLSDKFFWTPTIGYDYGFCTFKNADNLSGSSHMPYIHLLAFEFRPCESIGLVFRDFSISYINTSVTDNNTKIKASESEFSWATLPTIGFVYYF